MKYNAQDAQLSCVLLSFYSIATDNNGPCNIIFFFRTFFGEVFVLHFRGRRLLFFFPIKWHNMYTTIYLLTVCNKGNRIHIPYNI